MVVVVEPPFDDALIGAEIVWDPGPTFGQTVQVAGFRPRVTGFRHTASAATGRRAAEGSDMARTLAIDQPLRLGASLGMGQAFRY